MINNLTNELLFWFLVFSLATLITVCTNILGLTANQPTCRPDYYFKIIWVELVILAITFVLAIRNDYLAFTLAPMVLSLCVTSLLFLKLVMVVKEEKLDVQYIKSIDYRKEAIKVFLCVLFFISMQIKLTQNNRSPAGDKHGTLAVLVADKKK